VKIYGMVKRGVDMQINAASTVLITITLAATLLAMRFQRPTQSGH
jgi:ABC-type spermidine/putrescine transport system permease subunit II